MTGLDDCCFLQWRFIYEESTVAAFTRMAGVQRRFSTPLHFWRSLTLSLLQLTSCTAECKLYIP